MCTEINNALDWANQHHPVMAYFTKHFGDPDVGDRDVVHYAAGPVSFANAATPYLKGNLKVSRNTDSELMAATPTVTYDVEIFPDGTIRYLMKIDDQPVGGIPVPKTLQATCVNGVLLTASKDREVVTVGVTRKPAFEG